jgi:hypothetical protein
MEQLRTAALFFLDGAWARRAAETGWTAVQLFGLCPAAPTRRCGAWGLTVFLAWSVFRPEITAIDAGHASLRTAAGAKLRKPRELPEAEISIPFWGNVSGGCRMTNAGDNCCLFAAMPHLEKH